MTDALLDAVARFRKAAIDKGDWASPAERDAKLHAEMRAAWIALYEAGREGQAAFKQMLHDPSSYVRSWVAAQLLSEGDRDAIEVLRLLAMEDGFRAVAAKTTLAEWRTGRLGSPFHRR